MIEIAVIFISFISGYVLISGFFKTQKEYEALNDYEYLKKAAKIQEKK